jgi:hypothetical protein
MEDINNLRLRKFYIDFITGENSELSLDEKEGILKIFMNMDKDSVKVYSAGSYVNLSNVKDINVLDAVFVYICNKRKIDVALMLS